MATDDEALGSGSIDAFVVLHSATTGDVIWVRQFGSTSADYARDISADATGVYAVGSTRGQLPGQTDQNYSDDAFIRR